MESVALSESGKPPRSTNIPAKSKAVILCSGAGEREINYDTLLLYK